MADEVEAKVRETAGRSPLRVEGAREQQWVLIDYGDIVVHVFSDETRSFYEIERLYRDSPEVEWATTESAEMPGVTVVMICADDDPRTIDHDYEYPHRPV